MIELPGWTCSKCSAFNGEALHARSECRACDCPRERLSNDEVCKIVEIVGALDAQLKAGRGGP